MSSKLPLPPLPCCGTPPPPPFADLRVLAAPANKLGYELRYFKMAAAEEDEE